MPIIVDDKKVFSLLELGSSIQRMFDKHYNASYWVKAEMNKLNHYGRSGHCHPDLVEKENGRVVAEMRANLWKGDYQRIDAEFKKTLGEPLKEGIKMLFKCTVGFHPKYGLSLRIIDIDVGFTLGDLAREKKETLERLTKENLLLKNKALRMPILPKRIAIISVETSNGYADFIKVLQNNPYGYRFEYTLFPSLLQGDRAVATMLRQLEEVRKRQDSFDLVAIIRGGGGDIGLSFLNKYDLAKSVAEFPLPVVTGIGHATNQTVVELIAHTDAITPTEMAEHLIQHYVQLETQLDDAMRKLRITPKEILFGARESLDHDLKILLSEIRRIKHFHKAELRQREMALAQHAKWQIIDANRNQSELEKGLLRGTRLSISEGHSNLAQSRSKLTQLLKGILSTETVQLDGLARNLENLSPTAVLKRGYSITRLEGKAVASASQLAEGLELETEFYQGRSISTVKELKGK